MPTDKADIYIKNVLFQKDVIVEYDSDNESINKDTPFHSGVLKLPRKDFIGQHGKFVAEFNNGRKYWFSIENGTIDLDSDETYFVLDDSYESYNKR